MRSSATRPPAVVSPRRVPGQTLKLLGAAVFLAFAVPLALLAGLLAWHQYHILTSWPAVDATVTRAEWTTTRSTSRPPVTSYGARFSFRYSAGGREYDSSTDLGYSSSRRSDIERWMEQMPAGSHRRIRYDPANPATISLAAGYTPLSFAAPFTLGKWAGLIALVSLVLFGLGWRKGKRAAGS